MKKDNKKKRILFRELTTRIVQHLQWHMDQPVVYIVNYPKELPDKIRESKQSPMKETNAPKYNNILLDIITKYF